MIRKILLAIVLIFLIAGIGFAFQNEPDGFRGLKWGDAPTEDMGFYYQISYEEDYLKDMNGNIYYKLHDKPYIGSVEFFSIKYTFNLRSNQFYKVEAICKDFDDRSYNILKIIFKDKFGEPTKEEKYFLFWGGDKAYIHILFDSKRGNLYLTIKSVKIHPEDIPEINKQKEVEKAKDDF
jgi:hypothetical protein